MTFIINLFSIFLLSSFSANLAHTSDSDGDETFFDCEDSGDDFYDPSNLLIPQEFFNTDEFEILFRADPSFMRVELELQRLVVNNNKFGDTFRCNTSYAQLAAKLIELNASSQPISVGDWGCGQGFTAAFLLLAGKGNAFVKLFDPVQETAEEANRVLHKIATKYLGIKYIKYSKDEANPSFSVGIGSGEQPPETFMARQNDLNIAFNIMHMMSPEQCDAFLSHLYKNTKTNGIAMIVVCGLPADKELVDLYHKKEQAGVRYPGCGIYNLSWIWANTPDKSPFPSHMEASFVSAWPSKDKRITLGGTWGGSYPKNILPTDGYVTNTAALNLKKNPFYKLAKDKGWHSYTYGRNFVTRNFFTVTTLSRLLEEQGFKVINSFYVNKNNSRLYPTSQHLDVSDYLLNDSILVVVEKQ